MDQGTLAAVSCAMLFVLCNVGTRYSLEPGRNWVMFPVAVCSVIAFLVFQVVCKSYGLAVTSGIVDSLLTVLSIAAGLLLFRESLTPRQYVGIALLIAGLYLSRSTGA